MLASHRCYGKWQGRWRQVSLQADPNAFSSYRCLLALWGCDNRKTKWFLGVIFSITLELSVTLRLFRKKVSNTSDGFFMVITSVYGVKNCGPNSIHLLRATWPREQWLWRRERRGPPRGTDRGSILFIYLFIYFWLCWVFVSVWGLSLVAENGGHSSLRCAGLSLSQPLLLRSTGSRRAGSVIVAHEPSCSAACGIFPDQGSNPCPLHWQADSQPLRHQGSPRKHHNKPFSSSKRRPRLTCVA